MSDTTATLRRKIITAGDLRSVVRTMKALAASNIGQYEQSLRALTDYARSVELGLALCFQTIAPMAEYASCPDERLVNVVVFGSDQGLVGRFNDIVTDLAVPFLTDRRGKSQIWAVGERVYDRLSDAGVTLTGLLSVPNSVQAITPLVGEILIESEAHQSPNGVSELHLFHNRPTTGALYQPVQQRLLPLDTAWRSELAQRRWPGPNRPEILADHATTLRALLREYLFVSLFQACAESLASENASRLAAMQRADKNIYDLLEALTGNFHRLRQSGIDEELFDLISGFEALSVQR